MDKMSKMFPDLKEIDANDRFSYGRGLRHHNIVLRPQDQLSVFVVGEYRGERKALAVFRLEWGGDGKFPIFVQHNPLESEVSVGKDWTYTRSQRSNGEGEWPGEPKSPKKDGYLSELGYQEP